MSDDKTPLNPEEIPEFTGDLGQLERDVSAIAGDASAVWSAGTQVDTSFRGLSAYYDAPEADRLFATTAPVAAGANDFSGELESIAQALGAYATEIRPIVDKLQRLKQDAAAFRTRIAGDEDWHFDGDLTDENNNRRHEVNAAFAAFQAAEVACANKIHALFGDFRYVQDNGDDKHEKNEYGFSAEMLDGAQGLPWGDKLEESVHWYEVHRHVKQFVWDGFIVDGLWGTLKGLGALVGLSDDISAGEAWTNLGKVVTGVGILLSPQLSRVTEKVGRTSAAGRWLDDSRRAAKEAGKAMISYDQWEQGHGARAAGGAVFNIGTAVLSGGIGAAAKGGAIARGISAASRAATVIDPMTYVARGARFGTIKISDAVINLRGISTGHYVNVADGAYRLADDPVQAGDLPANSGLRPDNTLAYTDPQGRTVYLNTETTKVHAADGTAMDKPVIHEKTADQRAADQQPTQQPAAQPEPELVGAGGRAPGNVSAHVDGSGRAAGEGVPSGAHDPGHRGASAGHTAPDGEGGTSARTTGHFGAGHGGEPSGHSDGAVMPHESGDLPRTSGGAGDHDVSTGGSGDLGATDLPSRYGDMPPPGPGEKLLDHLAEARVERSGDLISRVDGRPVAEYLDELSTHRAETYLRAKEAGNFPKAQVGACVGSVMDLRTGRVVEGINGPKSGVVIPLDKLHPTLRARYEQIADAPPHRAPILAHAEVKAANELLWARKAEGLPDGEAALTEMRASVQFPYLLDKATGKPPRNAPFCGNCNHMLEGVPSSYGRFLKDPPSPETWIP